MRIAISGQTYDPGNNGQAIFTIHLAEGLVRAGHEVAVIIPSNQFRYRQEMRSGVQVHRLRSLRFAWIHPEAFYTFFPAGQIDRIFREFRPDVVHIQDHYFLCRDVARTAFRMGIPVLGTNHFLPENLLPYLTILPVSRGLKISVLWQLMLWTYNRLQAITTPTETAARILRAQECRVPVTPISCGVDTDHFHPAPGLDRQAACAEFGLDSHRTIFLYVGRLDREKRVDLLIQGLDFLRKKGVSDLQLAIAGQGAARDELRGLVHGHNLDHQVHFLGYVANEKLPLLYQTADIFCMPSPEELQSIATLEAMASGRPVLAARARALPELVIPTVNGYLFEPNRAECTADGMEYLLRCRSSWPQMGRASRERAQAHSLANTIRQYEAMYRRL